MLHKIGKNKKCAPFLERFLTLKIEFENLNSVDMMKIYTSSKPPDPCPLAPPCFRRPCIAAVRCALTRPHVNFFVVRRSLFYCEVNYSKYMLSFMNTQVNDFGVASSIQEPNLNMSFDYNVNSGTNLKLWESRLPGLLVILTMFDTFLR